MRKPLPAILFFTDPVRTPDPEAAAARLPPGSGVVLRAFGAADAPMRALRLRAVTRRRRLKLLIGADAALARATGADGVHLPQRLAGQAKRLKAAHPRWIVTVAAHGLTAARRGIAGGADAVVVSTAFASASPSAGRPLGPVRLAALARKVPGPVYALGGVNNKNARRLLASGVVGVAAVEGLART